MHVYTAPNFSCKISVIILRCFEVIRGLKYLTKHHIIPIFLWQLMKTGDLINEVLVLMHRRLLSSLSSASRFWLVVMRDCTLKIVAFSLEIDEILSILRFCIGFHGHLRATASSWCKLVRFSSATALQQIKGVVPCFNIIFPLWSQNTLLTF